MGTADALAKERVSQWRQSASQETRDRANSSGSEFKSPAVLRPSHSRSLLSPVHAGSVGGGSVGGLTPSATPHLGNRPGTRATKHKDGVAPKMYKGQWLQEEDDLVKALVALHGAKRWSLISEHLPGRIGKQCRER